MFEDQNQKDIKIDGWRAYEFPIKYSEADYDEARREITDKIRKIPGLIALFEWGCIPAPGLSDMDFRAVFSDDAEKMYIPNTPQLSKKTRYLMYHDIFVNAEKHYRKYLYFDPWTTNAWPDGHRLLYQRDDIKRDLNFEKIAFSKEERDILSVAFINESIDALCSCIPFYAKKELPLRTILDTMQYCGYMIREINIITGKKLDPTFSQEFQDLRANWFTLEQKEAVKELIEIFCRGLLIVFEVAFALRDWIREYSQLEPVKDSKFKKMNFWNHSYLDKKAKNIYLNAPGMRRVFTDMISTPRQALELSANSYQELKINTGRRAKLIDFFIVFQPLEMAGLLLGLAGEEGLLSNNLRKDIFTNQENVPIFKPKIFQEKIKMLNEITEVYNQKQVINAGGKGWSFGIGCFGYLFGRESLKRKLLDFWLKRKFWQTINKTQKFYEQ